MMQMASRSRKARVLVGHVRGSFLRRWDGPPGFFIPGQIVVTDRGGRFHVEGVHTRTRSISARAIGFGTTGARLRIEAGQRTEVDIRLERATVIEGQVKDQHGLPIVRAIVETIGDGSFGSSRSTTDITGFFRIEDLAVGKIKLRAYKRQVGRDKAEFDSSPGALIDWDPVLKPGLMIKGRLLDEKGSALAHWRVKAQKHSSNNQGLWSVKTDVNGRFRFLNLEMTPHSLQALAPGLSFASLRRHNVLPGPNEIELRVADSNVPSAFVRGTLLDQAGQPALQAQLYPRFEGGGYFKSRIVDRHTGQFLFGPWPAGRYRLMIRALGYQILHIDEFQLRPGQTHDLGIIRLQAPGSLVARFEGKASTALIDAHYRIVDLGHVTRMEGRLSNGQLKAGPLGPGRYFLQIRHKVNGTEQRIARFFAIESGKTTRLTLRNVPSHERRLRLIHEDGIPVGFTTIRVFDLEHRPVDIFHAFGGWPITQCTLNLPPGRYKIEARETRNGLWAEQIMEMGVAATEPIDIKMK